MDRGFDDFDWLRCDVEEAARRLLGCDLLRDHDDGLLRVRVVEVEAYDQDDPASHAFVGPTRRNAAMFLDAGHAYVYLSHGIHHCLNVVTGEAGTGSGVLVRAVEPLEGIETMERLRGRGGFELTNGPGKVGQALALDLGFSGHDLSLPPLRLVRGEPVPDDEIVVTPRIGISKAVDMPRRFHVAASAWVSRPRGGTVSAWRTSGGAPSSSRRSPRRS